MVNRRKTNKRVRRNHSKKSQRKQKGGARFASKEEFKEYLKANWANFKEKLGELGISLKSATFASLCTVIVLTLITDQHLMNAAISMGLNIGTAANAIGTFANATANAAVNALRIPAIILYTTGALGLVSTATALEYVHGTIQSCPVVATVTAGLTGIAGTIAVYNNLNTLENQLIADVPEETFLDGFLDYFETFFPNQLYTSEAVARSNELMERRVENVELNNVEMNIQNILDQLHERLANLDQNALVPVNECEGIPIQDMAAIVDVAHASLPSSRQNTPIASQEASQEVLQIQDSQSSSDSQTSVRSNESGYEVEYSDLEVDNLLGKRRSRSSNDDGDTRQPTYRRLNSPPDSQELGGSRKRKNRVSKKQRK
jgi:hypothetical protein